MEEYKIDTVLFCKRAALLQKSIKENAENRFNNINALFIMIGKSNESNPYLKSAIIHNWLLGYEFPETILYITPDKMVFYTSSRKAALLKQLVVIGINVEILEQSKQEDERLDQLKVLVLMMQENGKRLGLFLKERPYGKVVDLWSNVCAEDDFEKFDATEGVSYLMAPKDDIELKHLANACTASSIVMSEIIVDEFSTIIDDEKRVSHAKLAEIIENKIDHPNFLNSKHIKLDKDFDKTQMEWSYTPIIQSGGQYDLKPSAISDDRMLHDDVIYVSLGIRYHSYCSNVGRTFLIDPDEIQQKYYEFVLHLQKQVVNYIKAGIVASEIRNFAVSVIKAKYPELVDNFLANIGFAIGIDFRDSTFSLNQKNNRRLVEGMTMCLVIGFQDIENSKARSKADKKYVLCVIDTIKVGRDGSRILTQCPRSLGDVSFFFKEEQESEAKGEDESIAASTVRRRTRKEANKKKIDESVEKRRNEHQKMLAAKINEQGFNRYKGTGATSNGEEKNLVKKFESFKRSSQLPAQIEKMEILVDKRSQSIILPIFGIPVPFHINTIKNVSRNDEEEVVFLRFNFISPGQGGTRKDDLATSDTKVSFIRSLSFKSKDTDRFSELYMVIQEMKKNAVKREAERKEMADVVELESLIELKNKRPLILADVFCRPALDGKRVPGVLEIHQNGIRYQSPLKQDSRIDVPFSNIRQIFYQPCDNELIVIIHFHFKKPLMIGKKKSYDLQIHKEASDIQFDETGNRRRRTQYGDEDELLQEQEERRRRNQLNKDFHSFSEKIAEASNGIVDVDVPFRELGFTGVPHRSNVLLQPTTECLVQLIDTPFTVLFFNEIELAHLERVQFGLKQFDMVFVFKDYTKPPAHINTIPIQYLESVKDWLDSVDIPFSEGPVNLNWPTIMKTINDDPQAFFEEGGWDFLASDSENSDEKESDDEISEFEAESEEDEDEASEFEEEEEDDDDFEEELSDEGEDWDELDRKARKEDAKANEIKKKR